MGETVPEPDWILEVRQWLQDRDNSRAAAQSAADNAALRERLGSALEERDTAEVKHADLVDKFEALRSDNTRLQNEVVMPLRERVKVLEDALRKAIVQNEHDMLMTGEELRAARAALEKP